MITSTARGTRVRIHRAHLESYLQVSDVGYKVDLKKAFKPRDLDSWNMLEALVRLGVEYKSTRKTKRYSVLTSSFPESHRLLIYLFASNIILRASSTNEARTSDIYFLDKMEHSLGNIQGIPLGSIITNHMWAVVRNNDVKHAFSYARFLTLVFQRAGVDFSNAIPTDLKKKDIFTLDFCRFLLMSKDIVVLQLKEMLKVTFGKRKKLKLHVLKKLKGSRQLPPRSQLIRPSHVAHLHLKTLGHFSRRSWINCFVSRPRWRRVDKRTNGIPSVFVALRPNLASKLLRLHPLHLIKRLIEGVLITTWHCYYFSFVFPSAFHVYLLVVFLISFV